MIKLKRKKYSMDLKTADSMLQNVFAACEKTPNQVPFDKIVLRSKQKLFWDNFFIVASVVLFLVTFTVPLLFPHSPVFMSVDARMRRDLTVASSELTEDSFSITLSGDPLDLSICYMEGYDDTIVSPSSYDRSSNTIVFPYVKQEYNIYLYDVKGKFIHLLLSPRD